MNVTWWCSFADDSRPAGKQFLGVVLYVAPSDQSVDLLAMDLWAAGLNPGGEMLAYPWSELPVPAKFLGRLLTKDGAGAADRWMANAYHESVNPTPDSLRELGTVAGDDQS